MKRQTIPILWRILVVFLVLALPAGPALAQEPTPPPGGSSGLSGVAASLADMAKMFIDFLIACAAILLALGFVTGFVQGQVATMFGMPHAMASTWMKVAGILICFVGAVLAIPIANAIIDSLAGFSGSEGIHLPGA